VIYSLLRTKDRDIAQELFFRIEGEESFEGIAPIGDGIDLYEQYSVDRRFKMWLVNKWLKRQGNGVLPHEQ
jgi:hypothetical protein